MERCTFLCGETTWAWWHTCCWSSSWELQSDHRLRGRKRKNMVVCGLVKWSKTTPSDTFPPEATPGPLILSKLCTSCWLSIQIHELEPWRMDAILIQTTTDEWGPGQDVPVVKGDSCRAWWPESIPRTHIVGGENQLFKVVFDLCWWHTYIYTYVHARGWWRILLIPAGAAGSLWAGDQPSLHKFQDRGRA